MEDKEFLQWIHDRLHFVHGEQYNMDFMHKLRAVVEGMDDKITPNITKESVWYA